MAAKSNILDQGWLALLLNATTLTAIAQNASSPLTNLYVALHTANPGAAGYQDTSEAAYGGYARVAVVRTSGGWTVTSGSASPVNPITFPTCTSGSETETYFSIGSSSSGHTGIYYYGPISPTIAVSVGVTPQLTTATVVTES